MNKIEELGRVYANNFQDCFTIESSDAWKTRFALARLDNSIEDHEMSEEDRNNPESRKVFVSAFIKEVNRITSEREVIVDEQGNKKKLVKRKKD